MSYFLRIACSSTRSRFRLFCYIFLRGYLYCLLVFFFLTINNHRTRKIVIILPVPVHRGYIFAMASFTKIFCVTARFHFPPAGSWRSVPSFGGSKIPSLTLWMPHFGVARHPCYFVRVMCLFYSMRVWSVLHSLFHHASLLLRHLKQFTIDSSN